MVGDTGIEPVASAVWRQRSPTELIAPSGECITIHQREQWSEIAIYGLNIDAPGKCGVGSKYVLYDMRERGCVMDKQDRKYDSRKPNAPQESEDIQANPKVAETGQRLQEEMDDLVDEIDKVLEENAAEFVKNYVQKGGE